MAYQMKHKSLMSDNQVLNCIKIRVSQKAATHIKSTLAHTHAQSQPRNGGMAHEFNM